MIKKNYRIMLSKSKPSFKKTKLNDSKFLTNYNQISKNLIKNLFVRDLGIRSTVEFIVNTNTTRLNEIKLNKTRSIPSFQQSITWLALDQIDHR